MSPLRLVTLMALVGIALGVVSCGPPAHERILAGVPIGSDLSGPKSVAQSRDVRPGSVMQWMASTQSAPDRSDIQLRTDGVTISTEVGMFRQKDLGDYSNWHPDQALSGHFTGEVVFFLDRGFADSIMIGFTYVDGRLKKKDWGYLPG